MLVDVIVYLNPFQRIVAPADYFRVWFLEFIFKWASSYLAPLNNEIFEKSAENKERILALEKLVLAMWTKDTVVIPKESAWFYKVGFLGEIIPLEEQEMYKEDWLGLKQLNEEGKIDFLTIRGHHIYFSSKSSMNACTHTSWTDFP
eukprot:CAMPEP_0170540524 /NCGR_PEP_ID=MMETSP0211-20121228/512_1 /TAXON_ID=311385 /ORGANISM="Pseudokeronopsis sp., Strain OXSARD2" /LENGTH=145 /DNA_ID=CAMNT_0010842967 /DNA_START=720 /DNA_END=1154 /DNA_ORIENTATION=+